MNRQQAISARPPTGIPARHVALPAHRRPRLTLYRYLAREALLPTCFALFGLTAVVVTQDLLEFSDLVINRGLSTATVLGIALYKAVPVAVDMFPFAILLGCLVALGRMGADREILVIEASGISAARLTWPVVAFASVMTVASLLLSLSASPWANASLDRTFAEISRRRPWTSFRSGTVAQFGGWQLEAREVSAGGDELRGILLWMPELGETIFADAGHIEADDAGVVEIVLEDGSVVMASHDGAREVRFERMRTKIPQADDSVARTPEEQLQGLGIPQLAALAREFVPSPDNELPRAMLEIHRRFALPAATLIFGILAVPLFLSRTTYSRASGGVMGLLVTVAYYGLMQLGEGLIQAGEVGVALGAWLPNLVLLVLAAVLLYRVSREGVLGRTFDRPRPTPRRETSDVFERMKRPKRFALPRYVGGRFVRLAALSFSVLVVGYLLIDVMERLEWFARYHATGVEVVRFYGARIPLLASRVVPMALLVATSLTVSLLAAEGELIGMRSCGIPAPRALLPVLLVAAVVAPLYFLMNNVVVPRTNALADQLKRTEIKEDYYSDLHERKKAAVWYRSGHQVLEAERFDTDRGFARDLTIYEIGESGHPVARTDARTARHVGGGRWRLSDAVRIEIQDGRARRVPAPRFANLGELLPAQVDTMHLSIAELGDEIAAVEADGYDATVYRVDYYVKLAEPLACLVLPAVVLFFAVGGPPFPGPAQTLLLSAVLGVGYILLTGVGASVGYGGGLPPAVAGWSPTLLFSCLAGFFGLRLWRRL